MTAKNYNKGAARGHSNSASFAVAPEPVRNHRVEFPEKGCCWPTWKTDDDPRVFCAASVTLGIPYCAAHMGVAYRQREVSHVEA